MNTPIDQSAKADLVAQAKEIIQQVDDFLAGDHSNMPPEEYAQEQQRMMARQSMAAATLLQAMGFKEKKKPLMQSEDVDIADIQRRAGLLSEDE
jgi:hypothetical protein